MHLKKILKAAFKFRNLALLIGVAVVSYITKFVPFMFIGAAGYIYFVMQTLSDSVFLKEFTDCEKINEIRELNTQCNNLYTLSYSAIDRQFIKSVNELVKDKDKIIELYIKDSGDYIRQKVVEQAIELVIAYIRLMSEYSNMNKRMVSFNAPEIVKRIGTNEQKLRYLQDPQAIDVIQRAVEMDKKVLENIQLERNELDRTGAKLTYIESTLKSFKQQAIASEISDDTILKIENIINESSALDNALKNEKEKRLI